MHCGGFLTNELKTTFRSQACHFIHLLYLFYCFFKGIAKSKSWSGTPALQRAWADVSPVRMAVTKTFRHISPRAETTLFWRLEKSQWIFIALSELVTIFVCEISCTFASILKCITFFWKTNGMWT